MYCIIKYNNYIFSSKQTVDDPDKILYINPNCAVKILINYIYEAIGIPIEKEFDLCTLNGQMKKIYDYAPQTNATEILEPFEKYVSVVVDRNEEGVINKLTPLMSSENSSLLPKIRKNLVALRRIASEIKKQRQGLLAKSTDKN